MSSIFKSIAGWFDAHRKAQLSRFVRLTIMGVGASPIVGALVQSYAARAPAVAVIVGALEMAWRQAFPAVPDPFLQPSGPIVPPPPPQ